jgi:hypothetical protein
MEAAVSITSAEFAMIVKGSASGELKQRFLEEAQNPDGDLRRMLRASQKWATTALNHNCPSPSAPDAATGAGVDASSYLRQAAFSDVQGKPADQPPTRRDLTEVILGTASDETILRVRNALEDPASKLSFLVMDLPAE